MGQNIVVVLPRLDIFACQEMQKCLLSMPGKFNIVMAFSKLQHHISCLKYISAVCHRSMKIFDKTLHTYSENSSLTATVPFAFVVNKFPSLDKFSTHAVTGVTDKYQLCSGHWLFSCQLDVFL